MPWVSYLPNTCRRSAIANRVRVHTTANIKFAILKGRKSASRLLRRAQISQRVLTGWQRSKKTVHATRREPSELPRPPAPAHMISAPVTFHLDKVQLVDRLQEGSAVQGQVEVAGHPGGEGSLPPLTLRHVDPPDQSVGDLRATVEKASCMLYLQENLSQRLWWNLWCWCDDVTGQMTKV